MASERLGLMRALVEPGIIEEIRNDPEAREEISTAIGRVMRICAEYGASPGLPGMLDSEIQRLGGLIQKYTGFTPRITPELRGQLARNIVNLLAARKRALHPSRAPRSKRLPGRRP